MHITKTRKKYILYFILGTGILMLYGGILLFSKHPLMGTWEGILTNCHSVSASLTIKKNTFRYQDERTNACSLFNASPFIGEYRVASSEQNTYTLLIIDPITNEQKTYTAKLLTEDTLLFENEVFTKTSSVTLF